VKELLRQGQSLRESIGTNDGKDSYYKLIDEDTVVSNRLPRRPRLRIAGLADEPVHLLPVTNEFGDVVPHQWVLPAEQDADGNLRPVAASTDEIRRRMKALNCGVRVLT
jgi:hypothetical protein